MDKIEKIKGVFLQLESCVCEVEGRTTGSGAQNAKDSEKG